MSQVSDSFGGRNRYYDVPPFPRDIMAQRRDVRSVREMLSQAFPDLDRRVERAYRQWNLVLRDYLRNETALRLTVGDETQAVPVRIVDGLPLPFADLVDRIHDLIWNLTLHRSQLEQTAAGLGFLRTHHDQITAWRQGSAEATIDEVIHSEDMVQGMLAELNKHKVAEGIKAIETDILGAYFFRVPEIHLYWMVIGTIAGMIGASIEGLTGVVLAHELAHAYTHLGRDIDKKQWDTGRFAGASLYIVEGMAQFYTHMLCERLQERFPAMKDAYDKMEACGLQGGPYVIHKEWLQSKERIGEVMRFTMIDCRTAGICEHSAFEDALLQTRQRIAPGTLGMTAKR